MEANQAVDQEMVNQFVGSAHGDFAAVKKLLEQGPALLNTPSAWNETAIQAAAQTGQVAIAEYLLSKGAPLDICTAVMLGRTGDVEAMLGQDPSLVHARGAHNLTLLYFAAIKGRNSLADYLLSKGAEVNAGGGVQSPLHGAIVFNQPEMVDWLLEHNADLTALDYENKTPLKVALDTGKTGIASKLRAHGAIE